MTTTDTVGTAREETTMSDDTTRLRALRVLLAERADRLERAEARVAELEAIIAGRTTPPTRAEFDALAAAGGWVRYLAHGASGDFPAADPWWGTVEQIARRGDARWWACRADKTLCPFPVAEVSR